MIDPTPIAPAWLTLPVGSVALVLMAGHLLHLHASPLDPGRKRIRVACTGLLMLVTPIFVYASSVASPGNPRVFVLTWMLVAALMLMVLLLALADVARGAALHRAELRDLRRHLAELTRRDLAALTPAAPARGDRRDA